MTALEAREVVYAIAAELEAAMESQLDTLEGRNRFSAEEMALIKVELAALARRMYNQSCPAGNQEYLKRFCGEEV